MSAQKWHLDSRPRSQAEPAPPGLRPPLPPAPAKQALLLLPTIFHRRTCKVNDAFLFAMSG